MHTLLINQGSYPAKSPMEAEVKDIIWYPFPVIRRSSFFQGAIYTICPYQYRVMNNGYKLKFNGVISNGC